MNWIAVINGLILICSWMACSMAAAVAIAWLIRKLFPRKPEDDYTYVLKSKNGKKINVVLPPSLPEEQRAQIMSEAYRKLGF